MKILLIASLFLFLTGCKNTINNEEYFNFLANFKNVKQSTTMPFDINVELEELTENEYRYVISIDNAKKELKNIMVLATHDYETNDIFPSIGIFDEKVNLIPNKIDESKNIVKGILLIGYLNLNEKKDIEFKIYLKTSIEKYYFIYKHDNI